MTISQVATQIEQSLPCFGLRVDSHQAACLAALYVKQRPAKPFSDMIEIMLSVPELYWLPDDDLRTKTLTMRSLIEHLDGLYLVDTFEHDGTG